MVPVLRNADQLSFAGIEKSLGALGKKARDGTISIDDMAGGTFTISNGGVYGSMMSTPIINPPQASDSPNQHVIKSNAALDDLPTQISTPHTLPTPAQSAILGMHAINQRPMVMPGGKIEARPMMYTALTYDHR